MTVAVKLTSLPRKDDAEARYHVRTIVTDDNGVPTVFKDTVDSYHQARLQEAYILVQYAKIGHRIVRAEKGAS